MKKLRGVITPLSTPMDEKERVDYDSLEELCSFLIEKGINGLYPNGTTGEVIYLSIEERKKILEHTLKAAAGRAAVFSMVGAAATRETIELAQHAQAAGADGIGVVTPYYMKLSQEELFRHFKRVADSVDRDYPVYLYAIPQMAVNDISVELAERIADACPNVAGIKYSYPDMPRMLQLQEIRQGTFSVLTGPDDLFYALLACGGDGTISGNSNVIPEHYAAIYKAFQLGDRKKADMLQRRTSQLNGILSSARSLARYKAALVHRKVIRCAALRAPLAPISAEEAQELYQALEEMDYTNPQ